MNRRSLNRFVVWLIITIMTTACASSAPTVVPMLPNPFDQKVDVGGYALRIVCTGEGTPTVIVEAGLGDPALESGNWTTVRSGIEKTTRICVYDRAGLGSSDEAPSENRTSQDLVEDLHTLLVNARVPGPYILVGHSIGGFNVRLYASQYPNEVVGMILVDSSHPDQWSEFLAVFPPESPGDSSSLKRWRISSTDPSSTAANIERLDIVASAKQVRAVKSLDDLLLVVLTHSPTSSLTDLPPEVAEKIEQVWQKLQNDLAGLSSNSTHIIAKKAGHFIQRDEPQLVIAAILKVVDETKGK